MKTCIHGDQVLAQQASS
ncbi:hypothetical protein ACLB1N_20515 [Escherichia coli]